MAHTLLVEDEREPWRFPGTEPATWLERAAAAALDRCAALVALVPVLLVVTLVLDPLVRVSRPSANGAELYEALVRLALLVVVTAVEGWNLWWRQGRTGQSLGKRLLGLHLVHLDDGLPVGPAAACRRDLTFWLLFAVCALPGVLNLLAPLWDAHGRNLSDRVVDAIVVSAR